MDSDLRDLWQQGAEAWDIAVDERRLAEELPRQAKAMRRGLVLRNILETGACLFLVFFFAPAALSPVSLLQGAGAWLILASATLITAILWGSLLRRGKTWTPEDLAAAYGRELRTQIRLLGRVWLWYVLPLLSGVLMFVWGLPGPVGTKAAVTAFTAVVGIFVILINRRAVAGQLKPRLARLEKWAGPLSGE